MDNVIIPLNNREKGMHRLNRCFEEKADFALSKRQENGRKVTPGQDRSTAL